MLRCAANSDSWSVAMQFEGATWPTRNSSSSLAARSDKRLRDMIARVKARILLKADQGESGEGWADEEIYRALDTNVTMVARVREKLVTDGLDAVFARKKRETPPIEPIFDGKRQAQLIALACSKPPAGRARWTIRLLAEQVVERKIVESARFNTVARAQKKRPQTAPAEYWVIPPKSLRGVRAAMEDVLEVYTRAHDPARPFVCLDETSKQLVAETRTPLPMQPGPAARYDYEYERNGTASLFMLFAPLEGWRHVTVTERLVERFEWHYTPRHGSRLNMAESELAILSTQCLDRRISDRRSLQRQVAAWLCERNT